MFSAKVRAAAEETVKRQKDEQQRLQEKNAERTKLESEDNDLSTPGPTGSEQGPWPRPPPGLLNTSEIPLELLQQETSRVQTLE